MTDGDATVWVLLDDRAGNRSQALGVAEALALPFSERELVYGPLARLPNSLLGATFGGLTGESRGELQPPWPDLVIAAGRRTAPVARAIKLASGGTTRLVQIMDPGPGDFNLIMQPSHDRPIPGNNVLRLIGAPHRLTDAVLAEARETWAGRFDDLTTPRLALIVGGSTRRRRFTADMARELAAKASELAAGAGGSLLVTTSRRSGDVADILIDGLTVPYSAYRWGDNGENPYIGYLALADAIIVTGDSVSMCSEACAAGCPTYIYAPAGLITPKHARLHETLYAAGYARPLGDRIHEWSHAPLLPAIDVAEDIRRRGLLTEGTG